MKGLIKKYKRVNIKKEIKVCQKFMIKGILKLCILLKTS
jgi:hypothetical protein